MSDLSSQTKDHLSFLVLYFSLKTVNFIVKKNHKKTHTDVAILWNVVSKALVVCKMDLTTFGHKGRAGELALTS